MKTEEEGKINNLEENDRDVKRAFKGLWIPPLLFEDPKLTHCEKFLVAEIENLDQGQGCWASNKYLAERLKVSIGEMKNKLTTLRKKGYLKTWLLDGRRFLRIAFDFYSSDGIYTRPNIEGSGKTLPGQVKPDGGGQVKPDPGVSKDLTHSYKEIANKQKEYSPDSWPMKLSSLLLECILIRKPDLRKPNLQIWAKEVDLMIRVDGRDPDRIKEVIEWCQADDFWQDNILSTKKLREQFDKLELQMRKRGNHGTNQAGYGEDPLDKRLRDFERRHAQKPQGKTP